MRQQIVAIDAVINHIDQVLAQAAQPGRELSLAIECFYLISRQVYAADKRDLLRDQIILSTPLDNQQALPAWR